MKKRRILFGLAMAAAAVFSLASCGEEETPKEPSGQEVTPGTDPNPGTDPVVTKYTVTFETNGGSNITPVEVVAGGKVSRPSTAPSKTETATEIFSFDNWYKDAACTTLFNFSTETINSATTIYAKWISTPKQVEKYDVKFFDGETELTALAQEVDEDAKATKPTADKLPTQTGKRFAYWANSRNAAYDFNNSVTDDVVLHAVYEDQDEFDTLAAKEGKVISTSFYDDVIPVKTGDTDYGNVVGIRAFAENGVTVKADGTAALTSNMAVDLQTGRTGLITLYFEYTGTGTSDTFFVVHGKKDGAESSSDVFSLRAETASKMKIMGEGDAKDVDVKTTGGKLKVQIDTVNNVANAWLDGVQFATGVTVLAQEVDGLKVTAKGNKVIDNLAVVVEESAQSPLAVAKEAAIAELEDLTLNTNTTIKAAEEKVITKAKADINDATTEEEVATIKNGAKNYVAATKRILTVNAKTAADSDVVDTYTEVLLDGATVNTSNIKFTGATVAGIYTDPTLETNYAPTQIAGDLQLYAKITVLNTITLGYEEFAAGALNGQTVNGFTVLDTDGKITIDKAIKFGGDGSTSKANLSITLGAGEYTIKVTGRSGSKDSAGAAKPAKLTVSDGTTTNDFTFTELNDAEVSVTLTLTGETKLYFYRTGGNTAKVTSISISK